MTYYRVAMSYGKYGCTVSVWGDKVSEEVSDGLSTWTGRGKEGPKGVVISEIRNSDSACPKPIPKGPRR